MDIIALLKTQLGEYNFNLLQFKVEVALRDNKIKELEEKLKTFEDKNKDEPEVKIVKYDHELGEVDDSQD